LFIKFGACYVQIVVWSDRIHTTRHYFPNLTPRYSFAKPLDFVVFLRCTIHFFHCSDPSDLLKHLGPFISSVTNCICVYSDILKTYTCRWKKCARMSDITTTTYKNVRPPCEWDWSHYYRTGGGDRTVIVL
jgi:hypothetical protein